MAKEIRYIRANKRFTFALQEAGKITESVRPPKFSLEDKYAAYRRKGKEELAQKE